MYQPSNVPVTKTIDAGDEHPPVSGETTGEEPEFDSLEPETSQLPIMVVVGASAGGVEVLREFVAGLPENFPAVVCVNLHLPAHGERYLPRILSRAGRIPANHPRTSERIRRGTIYIAPPDEHLVVRKNHVELSYAARENHCRPSIDVLFRSAAVAFGERTIGIILSGTRDDGALGLRLIRTRGGVAIVQDPREATFTGMPESALAIAGNVRKLVETIQRSAGNRRSHAPLDMALDPTSAAGASTLRPSVFSCPD